MLNINMEDITGTVQSNGDILWSNGYTSRKLSLEEVARSPESFALIVSGHTDHPQCNGRYAYDGEQNGKPKYAKVPGGAPNIHWTGSTWDIY